jgi:integrase
MPKVVLTDAWLRANARHKRNDILTMSDLVSQNLTVQIAKTGRTNFLWRGRSEGKIQTIKLGSYPPHSLADARAWADAKTIARDKGVPIVAELRATRQAEVEAKIEAARTVRTCFEVYMKFDGNRGKDGGKEKRSKFERLVLPVIGDRPIADVTADDLGAIIADFMQEHPNGGGANRLHAASARMWRWLTFHPIGRQASGLKTIIYAGAFKPAAEKSRTSFLGDSAIRHLYQALEFEPAHWLAYYKLMLLTGARRSEISDLKKANVLVEPGTPYIMLRSEDANNDQYHVIPLSSAASAQLEITRSLSGASPWFFPANGKADAENLISGFTHRHNRITDTMQTIAHFEDASTLPYWTLHDFRRTMRTFMSKVPVPKHIAKAIISHSVGKSRLDATYDLCEYFDEKTEALTKWGDWVDAITVDRERYLHPVTA